MSITTLQAASFILGLIAYLSLFVFCLVTWIRGITGRLLLAAALLTAAFIVVLGLTGESRWSDSMEMAMLFSWVMLTLRAVGVSLNTITDFRMRGVLILSILASACTVIGIALAFLVPGPEYQVQSDVLSLFFSAKVVLSVCGLVGVEQLVRNTRVDFQWRGRYLHIGLGLIFGFSLIQGAVCLLFKAHLGLLTLVQPMVLGLAAPLIAVASLRNRNNALRLNLSRQFVFRGGTLIATGSFLMLMAMGGYFLRATGNDAGSAAVLLLVTVAVVALFVIGGSTAFRARARRFVADHFFEQQHDYRAQWERVTEQLTEPSPDFTLEQQAIRSILGIFDAPGGALWRYVDGQFRHAADLHTGWTGPITLATSSRVAACFEGALPIIELLGNRSSLDRAACEEMMRFSDLRFLVPLKVHNTLIGMIGIKRPPLELTLSDEDRDLVRLVSRQAAGFLALRFTDQTLSETRQFDTMNRLSTFLLHDLKTTSAQLSLLLDNAAIHKGNPEFIEDMLNTVENAVLRMDRLIRQVAEKKEDRQDDVELSEMLPELIRKYQSACPRPSLGSCPAGSIVRVNRDTLTSAIEHALENAIQATKEDGSVCVQVSAQAPWVDISILDNGCGMTEEFIATQLFSPFTSTKGVSGMGIGAFQLREQIRTMGGDVLVESRLNEGTRLTLRLPVWVAAA